MHLNIILNLYELKQITGITNNESLRDHCPGFTFRYAARSLTNQESSLLLLPSQLHDRLVGLVVKASASRAEDPGFESRGDSSGSSHTSDFKIGTPVATLPEAWRYWVSDGTGWPGVSILMLCEMENLICNFCGST